MDVLQLWKQLEKKKLSLVAHEAGETPQNLVALFDLAGLTGRRPADPSPGEIAARAAEIRRTWTPEIEQARRLALRRQG